MKARRHAARAGLSGTWCDIIGGPCAHIRCSGALCTKAENLSSKKSFLYEIALPRLIPRETAMPPPRAARGGACAFPRFPRHAFHPAHRRAARASRRIVARPRIAVAHF
ncbi:hypothetical protein GPZ81_01780 [Burkholderia pseudomallei]|nr:hypothetical protein [Burkholderia pseudomallei]